MYVYYTAKTISCTNKIWLFLGCGIDFLKPFDRRFKNIEELINYCNWFTIGIELSCGYCDFFLPIESNKTWLQYFQQIIQILITKYNYYWWERILMVTY
jgi:hypothetical protein